MKLNPFIPLVVLLASSTSITPAQEESKGSTTQPVTESDKAESELRSTGATFSIDENSILVTPENVKIPLTFTRTTLTPLVDETGKTVAWDQIRAGVPITVHYTMLGEKMVATKAVVTRYMVEGGKEVAVNDADGKKRAELALIKHIKDTEAADKSRSAPSNDGGTIMGFEQVIAIGDGNGGPVTQYVVNNSTQFVTPAGKPVAPGLVRTGVRVDVSAIEDRGRKIATRMVLHNVTATSPVNAAPPGANAARPATANSNTAAGSTGSYAPGGGTAWVDQFGNSIPGTLETGFLSPPLSVLPYSRLTGSNMSQPGATTAAPNPNSPAAGTRTDLTPSPGATNPQTSQPGATPPGSTPPNSTPPGTPSQPGTAQPGTRQPSTSTPSTKPAGNGSSTPAPAPARPGGPTR